MGRVKDIFIDKQQKLIESGLYVPERLVYDYDPREDAYHEARRKSHPEEYTTQDWDKLAKESPDGIPF